MPSPPPTTRRTVIEACPKNISTALPHVKPALTDPAAAGAPPSRCRCQCAPTTPPHCSRTFSTPPPWRCHSQRAPTTLPHCPRTSTAPPTSRCHCQRARPTQRHTTASAYTLTTGLTPAEIRRRTRRGRGPMRCSKTYTAQTDRTQTLEQGGSPDSVCTLFALLLTLLRTVAAAVVLPA